MSAMPDDFDDDLSDLLPEELQASTPSRGARVPVKRTTKQAKAAAKRAEKKAEADALAVQMDAKKAQAAQLAQVVNLHIAGYSFAEIGLSIGASADEIERWLNNETARYVRTQPALRTYVRNYVSGKYTELLDNVWDRATDDTHDENLDAHDRATRILDRMARLHGAEAPIQKEVKVENSPEMVSKMVEALAAATGRGYSAEIFDYTDPTDVDPVDVVETTVGADGVHRAVAESVAALEVSGNHSDFADSDQESDTDEPL